jgi:hypothetical protein
MSLTSPRLIAPFILVSLAALMIASCSQQNSPTAPSSVTASLAVQPAVTEYWVTLYDEAVPSADEPPPPPPPGSGPSPWPPGPPPNALPGVPVPTSPSTHPRVTIKIDPERVEHSGQPVPTFSCRDNRYTWYYDQHIHGETGVVVTFTERENFFDGRFTSKNGETIRLAGNGTAVLHTRWCSAYPGPHYTQTRYKGTDEYGEKVEISGPWVQLLTPR